MAGPSEKGGPLPLSELTLERPIRLLLSDFDGTMTDENNEISAANIEGICLAKKLGLTVGFATGRGLRSTVCGLGSENAAAIEYEGFPGVFCNGSVVFAPGGEKVREETIESSLQRRLLTAIEAKGLLNFTVGLTSEDSFCYEHNKWTLICSDCFDEEKPVVLSREEMFAHPFNKLMVWREHEELVAMRKELEHAFGDSVVFTMPYPYLLELCGKGLTKGQGLLTLTRHMGLKPEEVLVVGDSENDISMFREAGVAVAVGNAKPEAKAAAKYLSVCSKDGPLLQIVEVLQSKGLVPIKR